MWTTENRRRYERDRLRYPSDLTDLEWEQIEPLIPPAKRGGGKRTVNMREVVNGVRREQNRQADIMIQKTRIMRVQHMVGRLHDLFDFSSYCSRILTCFSVLRVEIGCRLDG